MGLFQCDSCTGVWSEEGMFIKTEVTERSFCHRCLKKAYNTLIEKKDKQPDEIMLLSGIRKHLKKVHERRAEEDRKRYAKN